MPKKGRNKAITTHRKKSRLGHHGHGLQQSQTQKTHRMRSPEVDDHGTVSSEDKLPPTQRRSSGRITKAQYIKLNEHTKQLSEKEEEIALLKEELKNKNEQITTKDEEISSLIAVSKRRHTDQHQPKTLTVHISQEYTSCSICLSKYSTDLNSKDDNIRKHLPVISASSKSCDHYFCHGCILKQQAAIAEKNDGKVPKWIPCMACRTKTAFCPSEPKYHRMLIDILKQAKWTDMAQVKEEVRDEQIVSNIEFSRWKKQFIKEIMASESIDRGKGRKIWTSEEDEKLLLFGSYDKIKALERWSVVQSRLE